MIKLNIRQRLIVYFSCSLLLFGLMVGFSFTYLSKKQATLNFKEDLKQKAVLISDSLTDYLTQENMVSGMGKNQMGNGKNRNSYQSFIRFIEQIVAENVWIIDLDREIINHQTMFNQITISDLPIHVQSEIETVLSGKSISSESFTNVIDAKVITVGTPVYDENGEIIAALFLHTPSTYMNSTIIDNIQLLFLILFVAFIIGLLFALRLAYVLSKPIQEITLTAKELSMHNYKAKTHIYRQDEVGELAKTMNILAIKLDEANQATLKLEQMKKDYIADISHELKTPVTTIKGSLELLRDQMIPSDQINSYHMQMFQDILFLERLIQDLLDLSRLQSPDFKILIEPFNLINVMSDCIRSMQVLASKKEIKIHLDTNLKILIVNGDYSRIRQMINIILDNAIKFGDSKSTITIQLDHDRLSISNQGPTIPIELQNHLFDRFKKGNEHINQNGTGLGLAIVKEISNRHGLDVSCISENQITTFIFDITTFIA